MLLLETVIYRLQNRGSIGKINVLMSSIGKGESTNIEKILRDSS